MELRAQVVAAVRVRELVDQQPQDLLRERRAVEPLAPEQADVQVERRADQLPVDLLAVPEGSVEAPAGVVREDDLRQFGTVGDPRQSPARELRDPVHPGRAVRRVEQLHLVLVARRALADVVLRAGPGAVQAFRHFSSVVSAGQPAAAQ